MKDDILKIGAPKEIARGEARVAVTPDSALQLHKLGHECLVESGAGKAAGFDDQSYFAVGVTVVPTAEELWAASDVIVKVRPPDAAESARLKADKTLISFFDPGRRKDELAAISATGANVLAMDMVPRISRAQKMDALSSMANIAGYRATIEAGASFGRFFTGQVTAAGKVPPARVLVIGAGVAGLAAIGAATSLGAITLAFDVRPEVAEQIESMGAQFVISTFRKSSRTGPRPADTPSRPAPSFARRSLASSANSPRASTSSFVQRSSRAVTRRCSGPTTWSRRCAQALLSSTWRPNGVAIAP